jgi:hypothetical protein
VTNIFDLASANEMFFAGFDGVTTYYSSAGQLGQWTDNIINNYALSGFWNYDTGEQYEHISSNGSWDSYSSFGGAGECKAIQFYEDPGYIAWSGYESESESDNAYVTGEAWYANLESPASIRTEITNPTVFIENRFPQDPNSGNFFATPTDLALYSHIYFDPVTQAYDVKEYSFAKREVPRILSVSASNPNLDLCWYGETYSYLNTWDGPANIESVFNVDFWTLTDESVFPEANSGVVKDLTVTVKTTTANYTLLLDRY